MRSRNIKPGFYTNEDLAECSCWARLIFPGLWMMADKNGVLENRPKRIKAQLLPFDSVEIEPLIGELEARKLVVKFEKNGASYLWIPGFMKHQSPHYSEKTIGIQPPDQQEEEQDQGASTLGIVADDSRNDPPMINGSNHSSSLNPSSLNHESIDPPPRRGSGDPPGFDRFWAAYPRRVAKAAAVKAFTKLRADDDLLQRILAALSEAKRSPGWLKDGGQFVPHPATWLNGRRWEDEPTSASSPPPDPLHNPLLDLPMATWARNWEGAK
jgi:hypothetical protein